METDNHSTADSDFEFVQDGEIDVDAGQVLKPTDNGADQQQQQQQQSQRNNVLADNDQQLEELNCQMKLNCSEFRAEIGAKEQNNVNPMETVEQKLKAAVLKEKIRKLEEMEKSLQSLSMSPSIPTSLRPHQPVIFPTPFLPSSPSMSLFLPPTTNDQSKLQPETRNLWSYNCWNSTDRVRLSEDGLIATKTAENIKYVNIRAQQSVSRGILASFPGDLKFAYYEVQMKHLSNPYSIGWAGRDSVQDRRFVGNQPGSYGISWDGDYFVSCRRFFNGYDFGLDDTVGTGLLLGRDSQVMLFFTKNGRLYDTPIPLDSQQDQELYPAVSFYLKDASVEANFGADPEKKPFDFNVIANKAQLFG